MSRLLPQQTVDALRQYSQIAVDLHGIDCELFIPKKEHIDQQEELDIYDESPAPSDIEYDLFQTKVFIEWSPNIYALRRRGIYVEDQKPIVAWFDPTLAIVRKAWFRIQLEFIPKDRFSTDEFEIVEHVVRALHDATVVNSFLISPRRKVLTGP